MNSLLMIRVVEILLLDFIKIFYFYLLAIKYGSKLLKTHSFFNISKPELSSLETKRRLLMVEILSIRLKKLNQSINLLLTILKLLKLSTLGTKHRRLMAEILPKWR